MSLHQVNGLFIAQSSIHDRGVFCITEIPSESVIEIAPVIILPNTPSSTFDGTDLYDYYFLWGDQKVPAIVLGYGSIYNHSPAPNATFVVDSEERLMIFKAVQDIPAGTEITIDYHEGVPDKPLWFDVVVPV